MRIPGREHALDLIRLRAFLEVTQPRSGGNGRSLDGDLPQTGAICSNGSTGERILARRGGHRLHVEGIKHGPLSLDLFYGTPSPGNTKAPARPEHDRALQRDIQKPKGPKGRIDPYAKGRHGGLPLRTLLRQGGTLAALACGAPREATPFGVIGATPCGRPHPCYRTPETRCNRNNAS